MRIINVVEIINGELYNIESFPIIDDNFSDDQVRNAEDMFITKAKENGFTYDDDLDEREYLLDEGYWSDNNGYEVMISWSDVNL